MRALLAVIVVAFLLSLVPPRAAEWAVVAPNPAPAGYGPFQLKFVEASHWPGIYRAEWWAVDENGRSWGYSPTVRFVRHAPLEVVTGRWSRAAAIFGGDCPGVNAAAYTLIALFLARWVIRRRRGLDQ